MRIWAENPKFVRFLEILPGALAWLFIVAPLVLAFVIPYWVALFFLIYSLYFLIKTLNISRHMAMGYSHLHRNMKINWMDFVDKTRNIKELKSFLEQRYKKDKSSAAREELLFVRNLEGTTKKLKNWSEVVHVVIFAVSKERLNILEPSLLAVLNQNYPKDKIMVVFASEDAYKEGFKEDFAILKRKYGKKFKALEYYLHVAKEGEVRPGKGPNITNGGRMFWAEYQNRGLVPANTLVTNLDADHILHSEYLGRLTYLFVVDPNRDQKSYQPIPLLFNNIWDAPALNRIAAISNSFWQLVESMRTFRLRTFAAHTQSLAMLLVTDFWSVTTIVEDGHQYWRTYFALNGQHSMVAMNIPVYQDAVLGGNWWESFKNQYLQKRRWAWGVTDFPFVVVNFLKHKEIPFSEKFVQTFRQFSGNFVWATSSFILAFGWIPLSFNLKFQDTLLAHNITIYTSSMLKLAWIGVFLSVWISLALFPPRPKKYTPFRTLSMITMWILGPVFAIILSSLPAIEAQTRLMLGKKLEFFIVPKIRTTEINHKHR
jgi:hypothetical protein